MRTSAQTRILSAGVITLLALCLPLNDSILARPGDEQGDWRPAPATATATPTTPPTMLPKSATPTQSPTATHPSHTPTAPAPTATSQALPALPEHIVLGPDTAWPVRATRISGWGYELVDASAAWDWELQRDVYGQVIAEFWGDQLFSLHPHGIRLTLIDPVWDGRCPSPMAPLALVADSPCLTEGFGDGTGASIYVGCTLPEHHYHDPQECYIAIAADGEHLTDIVVAATITAQNSLMAGYWARTPDFAAPPFTPLLGQAYRDGDQWRWQEPFLRVMNGR
ncbi:MAG: hypothetical protein J5I90_00845 [Caldilineales bacterium]|nr:hypothetical protein [Caldilineales bacterium]